MHLSFISNFYLITLSTNKIFINLIIAKTKGFRFFI